MNSKCSGKLSYQRNQVIPEEGEKNWRQGRSKLLLFRQLFFSGCILTITKKKYIKKKLRKKMNFIFIFQFEVVFPSLGSSSFISLGSLSQKNHNIFHI